jgi:hypothetical protein
MQEFDPEKQRTLPFIESVLKELQVDRDAAVDAWDWDFKLAEFWGNARKAFSAQFEGTSTHQVPEYAHFVATFFMHRHDDHLSLDSTSFNATRAIQEIRSILSGLPRNEANEYKLDQQQYTIPMPDSPAQMPVMEMPVMEKVVKRNRPQSSPRKVAQPPTFKERLQDDIVKSSFSTESVVVEDCATDNRNIAAEFAVTIEGSSGPLSGKVECMDAVIDFATGNIIVALAYKEKKLVTVHDVSNGRLLGSHRTKKPVSFLRFFKSNDEDASSLLLFAEFRDVVLMDWKSQQQLRRWNLHRNIILQLDFVPPLRARFGKGWSSKKLGISLAFDHSIKIWDLADQADEPKPIDKIHSSSGQPFTAFCFRHISADDNPELVVAQEKGIFKIFKMRSQGSLHLVNTVTVGTMKYFPKVTCMNMDPQNVNQLLAACESDNRLFVIDLETGEIVKQFAGRLFNMDKHAVAQFSPRGNYVIAGSVPQHVKAPIPPTRPTLPSPACRRPSPYIHRSNMPGQDQAQGMNLRGSTSVQPSVNNLGCFLWNTATGKIARCFDILSQEPVSLENTTATHALWLSGGQQERILLCSSDDRIHLLSV